MLRAYRTKMDEEKQWANQMTIKVNTIKEVKSSRDAEREYQQALVSSPRHCSKIHLPVPTRTEQNLTLLVNLNLTRSLPDVLTTIKFDQLQSDFCWLVRVEIVFVLAPREGKSFGEPQLFQSSLRKAVSAHRLLTQR